MGRGTTWTHAELDALARNYPRYGVRVADWDEPVSRSPRAISTKALKLGVAYEKRCVSALGKADRARLRRLVAELCARLGLTPTELAREVSAVAGMMPS